MCATKLAFVLRRHDVVSTAPWSACRVERCVIVFPVFVDLRFLLSVRDSTCVIVGAFSRTGVFAAWECRHDCERVQCIGDFRVGARAAKKLGSKRPTLSFAQEIPALERDYVCDQVGLGWSRCGRHNVWCAKMTAISYARFAHIVEEGTRPALLPRCFGDFCVGACR